ncbi:GNAT family N-acetyltransferase [Acidovorax sp. NCPPB 3576]|uniref:GNAT family N-acetyltransferase n=1 Tax=Acidovorax sp. NCPPB 3576 TaxID=2940488 RepID=UPI0023492495|nr:GNAT family N-acetyltransferase [Acidovorax sp. NCPPB 3576]WCM88272.1 GNAT family N-acetyltransferase [Acidovorax sp. NCPPB 3576]
MTALLRTARPADAPAIAALHTASWRFAYQGALSEQYLATHVETDRLALWTQRLQSPQPPAGQHVIVAAEGDRLLGFVCAYPGEDPVWGSLLDNIHVSAQAHGMGIGAQLLAAVADHCTAACAEAGLYLWVLQSNLQAQRFYAAHGAANVQADDWDAPGGTRVPTFRFAWQAGALPVSGRPKPPRGAPA